jgi:hypothetical protein
VERQLIIDHDQITWFYFSLSHPICLGTIRSFRLFEVLHLEPPFG